jgi:glyoxylase-like metal-dependent hydrolase (beta-lactamase superfamily II)
MAERTVFTERLPLVRLTSEIALVGGGLFGFDLTSPADCHVYLIDGGDELALIDAGAGGVIGNSDLILDTIARDGCDPARVAKLFLTHYHFDHAGGAAELTQRLGCEALGSPLTARTLEAADEEQISLPGARAAGYVPDDYHLQACPVSPSLVEGAEIRVGKLTVKVVETPGHCDGHVSLLVSGGDRVALIQGDVVFHGGLIFLQNIPDCSIQKYAESVAKLDALDFEAFLPGHLAVSLRNGKRHVSAAAAQFAKLAVPKNIV